MEPRQLWDRNTVLAEAFCRSDDEVRDAQGTLDDAQATRARFLAAFAVTLRNDGAVADLLGLAEREVRVARRTVGKDDARAVAEELLASREPAARMFEQALQWTETAGAASQGAAGTGVAGSGTATSAATAVPEMPEHAPAASAQQVGTGTNDTGTNDTGTTSGAGAEPVWSAAMDAVLVGGWQTGVDLRVLANEFGLDLHRLVTRAQQLSVQGRLGPARSAPGWEESGGRHRKGATEAQSESQAHIPGQQTAATGGDNRNSWDSWTGWDNRGAWDGWTDWDTAVAGNSAAGGFVQPNLPSAAQGWTSQTRRFGSVDSAGGTQDWQGILHEWGDTPPVREDAVQHQQTYQPVYEQTFQQPVAQYGQSYGYWPQYV